MVSQKKHNVPSLETLVNQCCEDYYFKLEESKDGESDESRTQRLNSSSNDSLIAKKYFSSSKFKDFIIESHCHENLKFLIEIYHYEKIWNKIFKRQSSILKCKEESIVQQRKQSVATIFTNSSLRHRKHSIIEEPESDSLNEKRNNLRIPQITTSPDTVEDDSPKSENKQEDTVLLTPTDDNNAEGYLPHLSLPNVIKSGVDFDTESFVNQDFKFSEPSSPIILKEQPYPVRAHRNSNEVWDSLFKASYCDHPTTECLCKDDVHNHEIKNLLSPDDVEEAEYNESVRQLEIRETLKEELSQKFSYIVKDFVLGNSPYEINLPADVYSKLIEEYENSKILYHSPLTLLPAKNAVLQLLRENIYYKFLSQQERLIAQDEDLNKTIEETTPLEIKQPLPLRAATFDSFDSNTVRSLSSQDSKRSETPVQSLSTFLNRYHIKIHHNDSSSNAPSHEPSPSPIQQLQAPLGPHGSSSSSSDSTSQKTRQLRSKTFGSSPSNSSNLKSHPHHDVHYIKGPCGIEPSVSAYDPRPPATDKSSHWGAKIFKFRRSKKKDDE